MTLTPHTPAARTTIFSAACRTGAVTLWLLLLGSPTSAQMPAARDSARLDSILRAHRHPIELRNGRLTGPGAALLADAARNTQFFMMAESHYVGEIPQFTTAWFDELQRTQGVQHYAIEYGPMLGRMLSSPPLRGDTTAIVSFAARLPQAFHFLNDEELEAMAHIGARSASKAPVWGIDNEFAATHSLERLAAIAPDAHARAAAESLAERARTLERERPMSGDMTRFISEVDSTELDRLRDAFRPSDGSEAARLIDELEISNRIYTLNGAAGRGELTGYRANLEREQYQKAQFMSHYRDAQRAGDSLPRVLLKFGSLHGGKWLGRTNVHSLGNFVHEFATANGMESFHLVGWLVNEPETYWSITEEEGYGPLGRAGSTTEWVIVDFRPLRPLVHAGRMRGVSSNLRAAIFAYDAVLLIGSGTRGTYDALLAARPR